MPDDKSEDASARATAPAPSAAPPPAPPVSTAPVSPPEAGKRPRKLVDLMHLDLIAAGIYTARRGMAVLSLPMGAAEFDRFTAAFEEFLDARRPVIEAAGREAA